MIAKRPTEMLEEEHLYIQKVVGAMAVVAEGLEMGQNVEAETLQNIVQFMRTFADKCHHGKEESHLFPALERIGVPTRGCPLGILIHEHEKGRTLVTELAEAAEAYVKGNPSAKASLAESLRGLTDLYPNHIWKEEYLLFPMANKILSSEQQNELQEEFETVEQAIGKDVHQRFEQVADNIVKRAQGSQE
jgi:hemerythrin-like domain-containing protein